MTPTNQQCDNIYAATAGDFRNIVYSVIRRWEAIRPQDDAAKELAQAKADIAELNQRLHERTQAFLEQIGGLQREAAAIRAMLTVAAPLPEPKPTTEEIERREFEGWAISQTYYLDWNGVDQYCNLRTHRAWQAWKAARAK